MLAGLGLGGLRLLVAGVVGVVPEVVVGGGGGVLLLVLLGSAGPLHLAETVAVMQRHGDLPFSFLVVDLLDVVVDQQPVILQAELRVIADWGLDGLLAFVLLLWVAETGEVAALQDLGSSRPLLRVDLQHFQDQLDSLRGSSWLEPLIQGLLLGLADLLDHGLCSISVERFNFLL